MKKNTIIAAIVAASALLLCASCQKQEFEQQNLGFNGEGKVFTATIEGVTKTTITGEYKVNWNTGDKVSINGKEYVATPEAGNPTRATLAPTGEPAESQYTAVYPASLCNDTFFEFPSVQTYKPGEFNAPMYAKSNTKNLSFKNICGVLCFSLKGTDWIRSISVTADEPLCGAFAVKSDGKSVDLSGGGKTVTLDCYFSQRLDKNNATNFYIYLPPGTYHNLKVVVTNATYDTYEATASGEVTVSRSSIYTFNWELDFESEWKLLDEGTINETPYWNQQEERPLFYRTLDDNFLECLIPSCFGKNTIAKGSPYDVKDYRFYWNTQTNQIYIPKQYMGYTNQNGQTWFMDESEIYNWCLYYRYTSDNDFQRWIAFCNAFRSTKPEDYFPYFEDGTFHLADFYSAGEPGTDAFQGYYSCNGEDTFVCNSFKGFE